MILGNNFIAHLRDGGCLKGKKYQVSTSQFLEGNLFVLCGSDRMVVESAGPLQDGLKQLLEQGDELLFVSIERPSGTWDKLLVDLDKELGAIAMAVRRPLYVCDLSGHSKTSVENKTLKVLTLPADVEQALSNAAQQCRYHFMQYADGAFKLIRLK